MRTRPRFKNQSREGGYVLFIVLSTIIPIAAVAVAMTIMLSSRTSHVSAEMAEERSLAGAESVAMQGLGLLNKGALVGAYPLAPAALQHSQDGLDNDGDGQTDESDEIGEVRVLVSWSTDQVDNDLDGHVDEDDENVQCLVVDHRRDADGLDNDGDGTVDEADENYMLTLQGIAQPFMRTSGVAERRVHIHAQYSRALMPDPAGALYLGDPNANVAFNGNSFLVSGFDIDANGNATGLTLPGIGVEGPTAGIISELNNNQNDQVIGLGNEPSVYTVGVPNPFGLSTSFIEDWITTYRPLAHYSLSPQGSITGNPYGTDGVDNDGDGATDEADEGWFGGGTLGPRVTYVDSDAYFSGNNEGHGLLLVDGDLRLGGQFVWHGIIVARGDLRVTGGGNQGKLIEGAAFIGADIQGGQVGSLVVGGNVTVQFAQFRVDEVTNSLGRWRVWAFQEGARQ